MHRALRSLAVPYLRMRLRPLIMQPWLPLHQIFCKLHHALHALLACALAPLEHAALAAAARVRLLAL